MGFKVKCKCGSIEKTFKKDLGMEFFIGECCEQAGFDHEGNKDGEVKKKAEKKADAEYDALIKEALELYPNIKGFDPKNMPTKDDLKLAIEGKKKENAEKAAAKEAGALADSPSAKKAQAKTLAELQDRFIKAEKAYNKSRSKTKRENFAKEMTELEDKIAVLKTKMSS